MNYQFNEHDGWIFIYWDDVFPSKEEPEDGDKEQA